MTGPNTTDTSYIIQKAEWPAGRWWVIEVVTNGSVTTETRIGYTHKRDSDGYWEAWEIGGKYPLGPGLKTRKACMERLINKHKAPTREESIAAELAKINPTPAVGPEREGCRCSARIRKHEHRTIHDMYEPGSCPDDCHEGNMQHIESGTKFNQFDISAVAEEVLMAARDMATGHLASSEDTMRLMSLVASEQAIELWCKLTGLPRLAAIMVAAEIHNRQTPTVAIVAPF